MKKIFTLIAMAAMAFGASAQEKFLVNAETDATSYQGTWVKKATASVQLYYGDCGTDGWSTPAALTNADGDFAFDDFTHYVSGKAYNPKDGTTPNTGNGYKLSTHNNPQSGAYIVLKPSAAGSLQVGIVLNSNKNFYVTDGNGVATADYDIKDNSGKVVALDEECKAASKVYGKVSFNVEADKEYYVFCTGSKIGFMGFVFNTTPATIDPATTASSREAIEAAKPNDGPVEGSEFTVKFDNDAIQTPTGYFTFGTPWDAEANDGAGAGNKFNFNSKYTGTYAGEQIKKGLKMEGSTLIEWTATEVFTIIIVQSTSANPNGTIALDGNELAIESATEPEGSVTCREYKIEAVDKGYHTITRSGSESGLLYVKVTYTPGVTPTGIKNVKSETINLNAPMYNLAGQKVAEGYKGVVIQNGVKRIQK